MQIIWTLLAKKISFKMNMALRFSEYFFILNPTYVVKIYILIRPAVQNQLLIPPPLEQKHNNNYNKQQPQKNTVTMIIPGRWLPAASIVMVSLITLHHTMVHDICHTGIYVF
jgi:hypothetical protein